MWSSFILLAAALACVSGHGRVLKPPSRASAWRFQFPTPADYDDDGLNCGGYATQHNSNGGKCGICGDSYSIPPPRPHELGGYYGVGIIVANYAPGALITTTVELTTSHRGFWEFKLCPDPESNDQSCFDKYVLELEDGSTKFVPTEGSKKYEVVYRLPKGLTCEHCVLQWRYTAGNNWGICSNGTQGLGCGPQEQFGACSDISIGASKQNDEVQYPPMVYYLNNGLVNAEQGVMNLLRGYVRSPAVQQGNHHAPPWPPQPSQRLTQTTQPPFQANQQKQQNYNNQKNGQQSSKHNLITPNYNQGSPYLNQQQNQQNARPNHITLHPQVTQKQKQPLGQNQQRQILDHITSQINKAIQLQNQVTGLSENGGKNQQVLKKNQQKHQRPSQQILRINQNPGLKNVTPQIIQNYSNQNPANNRPNHKTPVQNHKTPIPKYSSSYRSTQRPSTTYDHGKGPRNWGKKPVKSARYKKVGKKKKGKGKAKKRKKKNPSYSTIEYNRLIRVGTW